MKHFFKLQMAALLVLGLTTLFSCKPDSKVEQSNCTITLQMPSDAQGELKDIVCTLTNLNNNKAVEVKGFASNMATVSIDKGLYRVDVTGKMEVDGTGVNKETYTYAGLIESVNIQEDASNIKVDMKLSKMSGDLVISEIYFTGSTTPEGKQYRGDQYIRLYNNSDDTVYADGVAIMESAFMTIDDYDYTPDIMSSHFSAQAIYVIPGKGKDVPVAPRSYLTICDIAIDHTQANSNSFDLSKADFEWYDESSNPNFKDTDNPEVPNLDKWYCYTATVWSMHNRGFHSYAIARTQMGKEEFLAKNKYTYEYELVLPSGTYPMDGDAYKVPNEWIIDAVNLSVGTEFKKLATDASLDRGWTYCGKQDQDPNRYNLSVLRKANASNPKILIDTNNSSEDFQAEATPSLKK